MILYIRRSEYEKLKNLREFCVMRQTNCSTFIEALMFIESPNLGVSHEDWVQIKIEEVR